MPVGCARVREQLRLTDSNLASYLERIGIIPPGVVSEVEPAGDGNINWVRRLRVASGGAGGRSPRAAASWIVKQARPALERFPEYRVTTERIVFEARYYEVVAPLDREGVCPRVVHFDEGERVLVLEDLGEVERLDAALDRGADASDAAASLGGFAGRVHAGTRDAALAPRFANDEMRRLHGDHIFVLPLADNDFPLSPALRERAAALKERRELLATASALYARYLEPKGALVHGDVQAGNVLLTARGPKLLDAEIAHVGDPAFDVGVLLGHLLLASAATGTPAAARPACRSAWAAYAASHGADGLCSFSDVARYAGIEMLRRTIGAARVAATQRDEAAFAVLDAALRLLTRPPERPDAIC